MSNLCQFFHINSFFFVNGARITSYWLLMLLVVVSLNVSAGTFFQDGFETGDLKHSENGARWRVPASAVVSSEKPMTGTKSLKITFPGKPDGDDAFAEQRFVLGSNYPEVWIRYNLYVPSNYYHRKQQSIGFGSDNNKFIYLWSGKYSAGFTGPGLSVQNWPQSNGVSKGVPKAKGPQGTFDKHFGNDGGQLIQEADRGKWLTIVIHAKYATPANNDGVFQLWKTRDGKEISVINKTDGNWYVPGQSGFDEGYFLGWANSGFDTDTVFYIDNVSFYTTKSGLTVPKPMSIQVQ